MPIKNLIFDMGDVLVKINLSLAPDAFCALGADRNVVENVFNDKEIFIQYHKGEVSSETFRTVLKQKLNLSQITDEQFDLAWLASTTEPKEPSKDFIDRLAFIEKLKSQGYSTFLLSNNNEIHYVNTIKCYGELLNKCIPVEKQYYSHHVGMVKPQPEIFKHILMKNNLDPQETLFFDDIPEYVKVAQEVGIHAMQFTREESMLKITDKINSINCHEEKNSKKTSFVSSMPLNEVCRKQLLNKISSDFATEIHYYTHPKVQTTAHAVGDPDIASWTKELYENKVIKTLPNTGDRFVEIERTLTAFYCYFLQGVPFKESYEAFTASQRDNPEITSSEMISEEQFKKIYNKTNEILNNDSDKQSVLMYLIIYSDIGKSPGFRELVSATGKNTGVEIDVSLDSDDLMTEILKKFSDEQICGILPSFSKLSSTAKEMLRTIYPIMQACFGHLYFLERGQKTLDVIGSALQKIPAEMRKDALDIVYLAQFFDGMGAQGQRKIAGSLTCTNSFAEGYSLMHLTLTKIQILLDKTNNIDMASKAAFNYYLGERANWLGFDKFKLEEQPFLTRMGCTLRGFTQDIGKILLEEFRELKPTYQKLLNEQLNFSKDGLEGWTKVNYIATTAQNLSRESFAKDKIREGIRAALNGEVCFAMLVKEMSDKFPEMVHDEKRSISFGEIAFLATKNPELFNPEKFIASNYILDPKINKIIKAPQKAIVDEEKSSTIRKEPVATTGLTGSIGNSLFSHKPDLPPLFSCDREPSLTKVSLEKR